MSGGREQNSIPLGNGAGSSRDTVPDGSVALGVRLRWPGNNSAVNGTRVQYETVSALLRDYPEFTNLDRLGGRRGTSLTVRGTPFEQRGLTPGHTGFQYTAYRLTGNMPDSVKPEVSVIAPAFGFPGGGWQIRFRDIGEQRWLTVDELLDPEYGVLE